MLRSSADEDSSCRRCSRRRSWNQFGYRVGLESAALTRRATVRSTSAVIRPIVRCRWRESMPSFAHDAPIVHIKNDD